MLPQPAVPATSPAGTTNFVTNTTGQTAFVSVTANGATMANYWVNAVSVATTAAQFMMTVPAGATCALQYSVAVPVWYWSTFTPAVPSSTTPVPNNTGQDISVVLLGGTVTHVTVNGTDRATSSPANVMVPNGQSITLTYSGAPVWAWMNFLNLDLLDSLGIAYASNNTVAASGASGYSPVNDLPYAAHSEGGLAGLGVGVAN
jgi:hypothetical protein